MATHALPGISVSPYLHGANMDSEANMPGNEPVAML